MGALCLKQNVHAKGIDPPHNHISKLKESEIDLKLEESALINVSYQPVKLIGKGAYGEVMLVKQSDTNNYYAMKIICKTRFTKK